MKILVVFYSLTGNTKEIANAIADAVGAEQLEIKTKRRIDKGFMRYFWGGRQVMLKETPGLLPFEKDVESYDLIFLGTPVWAGNFTPAARSFVEQAKLQKKKIALFATHGGGLAKTFDRLKKEIDANGIGNVFVGETDFKMQGVPPDQRKDNLRAAAAWAKEIASK